MFQLIKNYVSTLTKEKLNELALSKDINLSTDELDFSFRFLKKNYEALYSNPNIDLSKFKSHFTEENYKKITTLIDEYKSRYLN